MLKVSETLVSGIRKNLKEHLVAAKLPLNRLTTERDIREKTSSRNVSQLVERSRILRSSILYEYIRPAGFMYPKWREWAGGMHNERRLISLARLAQRLAFMSERYRISLNSLSFPCMLKLTLV